MATCRRFAAPLAVATAERERTGLIEGVQGSAPGHDLDLFGRLTPLDQPDAIPWDGPAAVVVTHQGHAPGHSAVFLPDSRTLIAGDMCSDIEVPLLDLDQADPVGDYLSALDKFAALPVERVIPGHGGIGDRAEFLRRIDLDRAYLENLRHGSELRDPRPLARLAHRPAQDAGRLARQPSPQLLSRQRPTTPRDRGTRPCTDNSHRPAPTSLSGCT